MSGGAVSAKADHVCRQKEVLIFDHCLNGKKSPTPTPSLVFYSLRTLCYITMGTPNKDKMLLFH